MDITKVICKSTLVRYELGLCDMCVYIHTRLMATAPRSLEQVALTPMIVAVRRKETPKTTYPFRLILPGIGSLNPILYTCWHKIKRLLWPGASWSQCLDKPISNYVYDCIDNKSKLGVFGDTKEKLCRHRTYYYCSHRR